MGTQVSFVNNGLTEPALSSDVQRRLVRIFEEASINSDIFMRHQNGCMVIENRCPADFSDYARLMKDNTLVVSDMNSFIKLSFTDKRSGSFWAFLLDKTVFLSIEAELSARLGSAIA